jgi:hypothetical protein
VAACEVDRGNDVFDAGAARDQRGPLVDHAFQMRRLSA